MGLPSSAFCSNKWIPGQQNGLEPDLMFLHYSQVSISQIAYSARIKWVSPQQTLVMLDENGVTTTSTNRVTISQLTPGTTYRFRVSAITQDEERGAEMLISGTTTEATGGRGTCSRSVL